MKLQQLSRGLIQQWCYDLGGASFLGAGLIGLVMGFGMSFAPKLEPLAIMISLTIVSSAIACGWQLNRISASEEACVIPGFINRVLFQCALVLAVSVVLSALVLVNAGLTDMMGLLGVITSWGMAFIYLCIKWPKGFFLAIFAYLVMPWLFDVYQLIADNSLLSPFLVWLLVPVFSVLVYRHYQGATWHSDARSVYLTGSEMGFYWLPQMGGNRWLSWLERQLHPVSFFVGPMLISLILVFPILMLLITIVSLLMSLNLPVYLILLQGLVIACFKVHWSRIQRWRSLELLLVLPGFVGREGVRQGFFAAQNRLIAMITIGASISLLLMLQIQGRFDVATWLHLSLVTMWSSALILGLGSACRTVVQISVTLFVATIVSGVVIGSLNAHLQEESRHLVWVTIDVGACLLAYSALKWGNARLWNREISY